MIGFYVEEEGDVCYIRFKSDCYLNHDNINLLCDKINNIDIDPFIRFVVFLGENRIFSKGQDISEICLAYEDENISYSFLLKNSYHKLLTLIKNSSKVFIAAINGMSIGVGTCIALACDVIYSSSKSVFYMPYLDIGLLPDCGFIYTLLMTIGYHKTYEFICTKEYYSADELYKLGILNDILDEKEFKNNIKKKILSFNKGKNITSLLKKYINTLKNKDLSEALFQECLFQDEARKTLEHKVAIEKIKKLNSN